MTSIVDKMKRAGEIPPERLRIFGLNTTAITESYDIHEELGKGTFARVYRCVDKATRKSYAVKVIDKRSIDLKVESLKTEVKILMNVKHSNIVAMVNMFEDDTRVFLVMELMEGGELFDKICDDFPQGYSEKQSSIIISKVIAAVQYLHSKGIIHRDLKPENLLFASQQADSTDIRIADFGLAKIWNGDMLVKTACGSPNYVAPEVLLNEIHGYTFAVDMWSIGVILYVLLCGFCPFFDDNMPTLFRAITSGQFTFPSPYWDHISAEAKSLVKGLLTVDPRQRLTPEQALSHPWIVSNTRQEAIPDITRNMLQFRAVRKSASKVAVADDDE